MLFVHQTWQSFHHVLREALLRQQREGTLPAELQAMDIQTADLKMLGQTSKCSYPPV